MRYNLRKITALFMVFLLVFAVGCKSTKVVKVPDNSKDVVIEKSNEIETETEESSEDSEIIEGEYYYDVDDVAEYIHLYKELPKNYITKSEANKRNWSVENSDGLVIGGDKFGNREGLLPEKNGRQYFEADISAGYTNHRGPLRLVFSNDGLIFYTEDHYQSYEQLY